MDMNSFVLFFIFRMPQISAFSLTVLCFGQYSIHQSYLVQFQWTILTNHVIPTTQHKIIDNIVKEYESSHRYIRAP